MGDFDIGGPAIGRDDLERLAREARSRLGRSRVPDCFRVSALLQDMLENRGVTRTEVQEFTPRQGYTHYALFVGAGVVGPDPVIVDASFDQFDEEHDTSMNIGRDVPGVVVAEPAASYLFIE